MAQLQGTSAGRFAALCDSKIQIPCKQKRHAASGSAGRCAPASHLIHHDSYDINASSVLWLVSLRVRVSETVFLGVNLQRQVPQGVLWSCIWGSGVHEVIKIRFLLSPWQSGSTTLEMARHGSQIIVSDGLHSLDMAELLIRAPFRLNFVPLTEKNVQTTETNSLCGASGQVSWADCLLYCRRSEYG